MPMTQGRTLHLCWTQEAFSWFARVWVGAFSLWWVWSRVLVSPGFREALLGGTCGSWLLDPDKWDPSGPRVVQGWCCQLESPPTAWFRLWFALLTQSLLTQWAFIPYPRGTFTALIVSISLGSSSMASFPWRNWKPGVLCPTEIQLWLQEQWQTHFSIPPTEQPHFSKCCLQDFSWFLMSETQIIW